MISVESIIYVMKKREEKKPTTLSALQRYDILLFRRKKEDMV
jgi:hypothetical protein